MGQMIIDITDIPEVNEGDIAEQTETITNEILNRLGSRLDRLMISKRINCTAKGYFFTAGGGRLS